MLDKATLFRSENLKWLAYTSVDEPNTHSSHSGENSLHKPIASFSYGLTHQDNWKRIDYNKPQSVEYYWCHRLKNWN
jgi:hypothetical protein